MGEAKARRLVAARAAGRCELCGATEALQYAHRVNRSHGGPWCPANALHLCHLCHHLSELHPAEAYTSGVRLQSWQDPHTTPVHLRTPWPADWLLDEHGCYINPEEPT